MQPFIMIADVILLIKTTSLRAELFSHCKVWGFEPTSLHCALQANLSASPQRKPCLSIVMITFVYLKNKYEVKVILNETVLDSYNN